MFRQTHKQDTQASASEQLLTKIELAKRLKVSTRTVDLWVKDKRISKIKIASTARFDWNDVLAQLKAGKEVI